MKRGCAVLSLLVVGAVASCSGSSNADHKPGRKSPPPIPKVKSKAELQRAGLEPMRREGDVQLRARLIPSELAGATPAKDDVVRDGVLTRTFCSHRTSLADGAREAQSALRKLGWKPAKIVEKSPTMYTLWASQGDFVANTQVEVSFAEPWKKRHCAGDGAVLTTVYFKRRQG